MRRERYVEFYPRRADGFLNKDRPPSTLLMEHRTPEATQASARGKGSASVCVCVCVFVCVCVLFMGSASHEGIEP